MNLRTTRGINVLSAADVHTAAALIPSHTTLTTQPAEISFLYLTNSMVLATNALRMSNDTGKIANFTSFSLK